MRLSVQCSNFDLYTASDHLPSYLLSSKGHSYKVEETAFQNAVGTKKPRWDWLEEKITRAAVNDGGLGYPGVPAVEKLYFEGQEEHAAIARPELETFGLAMTGGGKVYGTAHLYGELTLLNCISMSKFTNGGVYDV